MHAELGAEAYASAVTNLAWQGGLELPAEQVAGVTDEPPADVARRPKTPKTKTKKKRAKKKAVASR